VPRAGRAGCTSPLRAHELASLLDETVSQSIRRSASCHDVVNVVNARQEVSHEWGRSRNAARIDPSLAIPNLGIRLGSRHPALRGAGPVRLHVPPAHTGHRQGSQRGVRSAELRARSSRAWLNAAAFDRGKSSLATTRASRHSASDGDGAREHSTNVGIHDGDTLAEAKEARRSPCYHRPGQSSQVPTALGTAPSKLVADHYRASWSAFARR